jgi:hypothetical protein
MLHCPPVRGQDSEPPPLRLGAFMPGGVRVSVTDNWGTFYFDVTNLSDQDRHARVIMYYQGQPDEQPVEQFGRDVWVPARSTIKTWMLVGPAVVRNLPTSSCFIEVLLYDRSGSKETLLLASKEKPLNSRVVLYHKREPYTAVMVDEEENPEYPVFGRLPEPETRAEEVVKFVRVMRATNTLSEFVHTINPGPLPLAAEAYDGIDHFVLASGRIAHDPSGMRALRQWLQRGGTVWIMLDLVELEAVAPLLGDALDFQVVDRISLTTTKIETAPGTPSASQALVQEHERPVQFARVLLPPQERAAHTVNGWPAWFIRRVGRGKVVFTTLGARAWHRPRGQLDSRSPYAAYVELPIATPPMETLAREMELPPKEDPSRLDILRPMLADEIGYSIVSRAVVAWVFGGFLVAAAGLGLALRWSRRSELAGWLGPAAALGAAATFVYLGESARSATPPTVAVAQIVDADAGSAETPIHGLLAMYRPNSGPAEIGAREGGFFELDMPGTEGQTRRLMTTDVGAWHWENLSLPAGVRFAPFRTRVSTGQPVTAVARFGSKGVEGTLTAGVFEDLDDAILNTPNGRNLSVQLHPDGTFTAGSEDVLAPGKFLAGAVLSDRQRRRQEVFREFLKRRPIGRPEGHNDLLVWAKSIDMPFTLVPDARTVGSALLVIPLQLEHSAPGTHTTIPGPLVPFRQIIDGHLVRPTLEASEGADLHLRFQLPLAVLPFKVEHARLLAKIDAPLRRVTISGRADGEVVEIHRAESPLDPIHIDIAEERLLQLDAQGGLLVNVSLSDTPKSGGKAPGAAQVARKWSIEYLELEVSGQAE